MLARGGGGCVVRWVGGWLDGRVGWEGGGSPRSTLKPPPFPHLIVKKLALGKRGGIHKFVFCKPIGSHRVFGLRRPVFGPRPSAFGVTGCFDAPASRGDGFSDERLPM